MLLAWNINSNWNISLEGQPWILGGYEIFLPKPTDQLQNNISTVIPKSLGISSGGLLSCHPLTAFVNHSIYHFGFERQGGYNLLPQSNISHFTQVEMTSGLHYSKSSPRPLCDKFTHFVYPAIKLFIVFEDIIITHSPLPGYGWINRIPQYRRANLI